MESELACGQPFKNHYESTKFGAEVLVRASMDEVPTTIYRPAIVVGDSETGVTAKFDGPYYLLRLLQRPGERQPIMQIAQRGRDLQRGSGGLRGRRDRRRRGGPRGGRRDAALCDPDPVSSAELMRTFAERYAGREPSFTCPPAAARSGAPHRCGAQGLRRDPARNRSSTSPTR